MKELPVDGHFQISGSVSYLDGAGITVCGLGTSLCHQIAIFFDARPVPTVFTMRNRLIGDAMAKLERIDRDPQYAALVAELTQLERRLAETRRRRERALALKRGVGSGRTAMERAADLVKGGIVPSLDPDAEILACDEEAFILRNAIVAKSQKIEKLLGNLSEIICRRLESEHTAALRAAVKSIRDANASFRAAAEVRAKVRDAGYQPLGAILPDGMPPAILALGAGAGDGRQLDHFLRYIEVHSPDVKL